MNHSILSRLRAAPLALALAFALLVGAVILTVGSAEASTHKNFEVSIFPTGVAAGVATDVTFTFENTSDPMITMGSANITIPVGVEVAGHSGVIELRTMKLGDGPGRTNPKDFTFTVTATCPDTAGDSVDVVWEVAAKQANNFSGTGNDFDLDLDSDLTMTVNCEATPDPELSDPGPGPSPRFTPPSGVWDVIQFCRGNSPCGPVSHTSESGTTATLTGGNNSTALYLAIGEYATENCEAANGSEAVFFHVFGDQRSKTVTIGFAATSGKGVDQYDVCFGADRPWTPASGSPAEYDGEFYVGLLADCPTDLPGKRPAGAKGGVGQPIACVADRQLSNDYVVITVVAPPGDPLIKIG